ncbi:MAG TPA: amidohydrolase family protein [Pyrinomonadaceae bacterium]|nr:amidohydrolase family protein [Pyrinomonadaceae bacterium]
MKKPHRPLEAIKVSTFNGAKFLGEDSRIGSIAVGHQADLMIVRGNPAVTIREIKKVEIVFKDGSRLRLRETDPIGAGAGGNR